MGTEFRFGVMKKVQRWIVGRAIHHVNVLNATEMYIQKGEDDTLYVYFTTIKIE